jgi:hypothetical protein
MKFVLTINCDNAAFDGEGLWSTIGAILGTAADQVEEGMGANKIRDINGNLIGEFHLEGLPEEDDA